MTAGSHCFRTFAFHFLILPKRGAYNWFNSFSTMSTVKRTIINTDKAPAAIGPYNGSLGLIPGKGELLEGGVKNQTHQSLKNIGEILKAAGGTYNNVVKTTILLADINDFPTVNEVYKEYFIDNFPARATYQVAALPKAALVEIEAIAVLGNIQNA